MQAHEVKSSYAKILFVQYKQNIQKTSILPSNQMEAWLPQQ